MDTANIKEFRILYNKLDETISEKINFTQRGAFLQKVRKFLKKYPSFEWLKSDIKQIHDLRNLLIHEEKYQENIAIPTEALLKKIRDIIEIIKNPQTALSIASKNIFGCDGSDRILDIISVMAEKIYSQVPVFEDKQNQEGFIGLFSESCITNLLGNSNKFVDDNSCINKEAKIADILDLVKKPITDSWTFVPADMDVYKVRQMFYIISFDTSQTTKPRLGIIFVTPNGRSDEKIMGLITAWDLSKIR